MAGRCVAYGQGITFWPLREIVARLTAATPLSQLLGAEADAAQVEKLVAEAVGIPSPRAAWRRFSGPSAGCSSRLFATARLWS